MSCALLLTALAAPSSFFFFLPTWGFFFGGLQVTRGHTTAEFVIPQPPLILEDDDVVTQAGKGKTSPSKTPSAPKHPPASPSRKQGELREVRASSGSRPMTREKALPPVGATQSAEVYSAKPPSAARKSSANKPATPSKAPKTASPKPHPPRAPRHPVTAASVNSQCAGTLRRSVGQELNRRDRERDRIHALETTVLGWTRLVKGILKQDAIPDHIISEAGDHPGPMYEMNLRHSSAQNLASVRDQLRSDAVATVLTSLGENNPYGLAFGVVEQDVGHAAESAQHTLGVFVTLRPWFIKISDNKASVNEIIAAIRPAVHTMLLVWQNCKYYRSPKRLASVFQMMSNEIISQAQNRVDASLLRENPHTLLPFLKEAIRMCSMLRGCYLDEKDIADTMLTTERNRAQAKNFAGPAKKLALWPARGDATFSRLNAFIDRCNDLTDIADTTLQYAVLEEMEIGGPKGELLTAAAKHVLDEYRYGLLEFFNVGLDILDVDQNPKAFDVAYLELKLLVKRLDRRLSEILASSFTSDMTLPEQLKLVISYKEFGTRDFLNEELPKCYSRLAPLIDAEIDNAQHSVAEGTSQESFIYHNQPNIASHLALLRGIACRIRETELILDRLPADVLRLEAYVKLAARFEVTHTQLSESTDALVAEWKHQAAMTVAPLLNSPLLSIEGNADPEPTTPRGSMSTDSRTGTSSGSSSNMTGSIRLASPHVSADQGITSFNDHLPWIRVNFDRNLHRLLREATYMQHLGIEVPIELSLVLSEEGVALTGLRTTLESIINVYETLRDGLRPVERALFRERHSAVLNFLFRGAAGLTWLSQGTHDFVNEANDLVVAKLSRRLSTVIDNGAAIEEILESWPQHPAVVRTYAEADEPCTLDEFLAKHNSFTKEYQGWIKESSVRIQALVDQVFEASFVSTAAPAWKDYLHDLSDRVTEHLHRTALVGLNELLRVVEREGANPLVLIHIEMDAASITTRPPLSEETFARSITEHVGDWCESLLAIGALVPGFDGQDSKPYTEVTQTRDLHDLVEQIEDHARVVCRRCNEHRAELDRFCFLVENSIEGVYTTFIEHPKIQSPLGDGAPALVMLSPADKPEEDGKPAADAAVVAEGDDGALQPYSSNLFGHMHDLASLGHVPDSKSPTAEDFDRMMRIFLNVCAELDTITTSIDVSWVQLDLEPVLAALRLWAQKWIYQFGEHVMGKCSETIAIVREFFGRTQDLTHYMTGGGPKTPGSARGEESGDDDDDREEAKVDDQDAFVTAMNFFHEVDAKYRNIENKVGPLKRTLGMLERYEMELPEADLTLYRSIHEEMAELKQQLTESRKEMIPRVARQAARVAGELRNFSAKLRRSLNDLKQSGLFSASFSDAGRAMELIMRHTNHYRDLTTEGNNLTNLQQLTGGGTTDYPELDEGKLFLAALDEVYVLKQRVALKNTQLLQAKWTDVDLDEVTANVQEQLLAQQSLQACATAWDVTKGFLEHLQAMDKLVPLVKALRSDTMRLRHWKQILRMVGLESTIDARSMPKETLEKLLLLKPIRFGRAIMGIVQQAEHDVSSEGLLKSFEEFWMSALFKFRRMKSTTTSNAPKTDDQDEDDGAMWLVNSFDDAYETIQDHQMSLQTMLSDKSITVFSREISGMQTRLRTVELVLRAWEEVQRLWEMIFSLLHQSGKLISSLKSTSTARTPGSNKPSQARRRSTMINSITRVSKTRRSQSTNSTGRGGTQRSPGPPEFGTLHETQRDDLQEASVGFGALDTTFRTLLDTAQGDPAIMRICCEPGRLQVLQNMRSELVSCGQGIERWLAERRSEFSRFYFLSAHDVMSVYASCTQPDNINAHISSLFCDIAKITIEERSGSNWAVKGFVGRCGETVEFKGVAWPLVDQAPEVLRNIVSHTTEALKDSLKTVLQEHSDNWVLSPLKWDDPEDALKTSDYSMGWIAGDRLTETVVLAVQLTHTREVSEALASGNVSGSLGRIVAARNLQLGALHVYGQHVLSSIDVHKVSVLTTLFVHQRDVAQALLEDPSVCTNSFNWQSQLKYVNLEDESNRVSINSCNGSMNYGFEYVARTHSLVMTPLTERCWFSILQAIQCKVGAACMSGPAYGKATTIRQLSYAVGKNLYELNCTAATQSGIVQDWLTGMASTGTWTLFRHVQKLSAPILAVMADSLRIIYEAFRSNKESAVLAGNAFELATSCPCLMTFGDKGGTTFPDSLRPYFRVSMMSAPHLSVIAEVLLLSYNFLHARELAQKLVVFYELAAKLFGENVHDWSVRSLRTVLEFVEARRLACVQKGVSLPELQVFCNALAQYNSARMRSEMERNQLENLFQQVFGDTTVDLERDVVEDADGVYLEHIVDATQSIGLHKDDAFCNGVEELGELLCLRRTILLVGAPGSGKSSRWKVLKEARDAAGKQTTKVIRLNPSALGDRLFGYYTKDDGHPTFQQGLLPQMLLKLNAQSSSLSFADDDDSERIWIIFDGPLNEAQSETFITAMDGGDLQLLDGSRVQIGENVNFICEVSEVKWLTPDMLPCVGIIRISEDWQMRNAEYFVDTWTQRYEDKFDADGLSCMATKAKSYLNTINAVERGAPKPVFVTKTNICLPGIFQTAAALFDSLLKHVADEDEPLVNCQHLIGPCLEFAMMWSFGGILATGSSTAPASRQFFSDWWRKNSSSAIPVEGLVWDYFVQPKTGDFVSWGTDVPQFKCSNRPALNPYTYVPTLRTEAFLFVMQMLIESGRPIVLVGPSGAGKTNMLREKLRVLTSGDLADWSPLAIQANQRITSKSVWHNLEKQLECKSERAYFPRDSSKGLMCCLDDMNMATDSSSCEFLRQLIDHGGVYDERTCVWKEVRDVSLMMSTDTLVDSQSSITRLYRHVAVIACPLPDRNELSTRYLQYMKAKMNAAQPGMSGSKSKQARVMDNEKSTQLCEMVCAATIDLHYRVSNLYMDTMTRSHYVFGPRDLDTIFHNMCRSGIYFRSKPEAVFTWATECRDVYALRLTDGTDVSRFWDALEKTAHSIMGPEFCNLIGRTDSAPIYRSVSDSGGASAEAADDVIANTPQDRATLLGVLDTLAKDCSAHHSSLDVHVHEGLFYQLNYLIRVLQRPAKRASCLLIGTGANDLAQLGGFVCQYTLKYARDLHTRPTAAFHDEFSELAMNAGTRDKKILYVVDAMHVSDNTLATIADFICSGNISPLLSADHNVAINTLIRPKLVAEGLPISDKMCRAWFVANARKNLRIVLTMPAGARSEKHRYHLRHQFSPILECVDVIWCTPRPRHDLRDLHDLASSIIDQHQDLLKHIVSDADALENCTHLFANIHSAVLGARAPSPSDEANQQIFVNQGLFAAFISQVIEVCNSYMTMIEKNRTQLQSGLSHADSLTAEAEDMRYKLQIEEVTLDEKQTITVSLLGQIGRESWSLQQARTGLIETESQVKTLKEKLPGIQETNAAHKADTESRAATLNLLVDKLNDKILTDLQTRPAEDNAVNMLSAIIILLDSPVHPDRLDLSWRTGGSRFLANRSEFRERLSRIASIDMLPECLEAATKLFKEVDLTTLPTPLPEALTILHEWTTGALALHKHLLSVANPVAANFEATSLELKNASRLLGEIRAKTDALDTRIKGLSVSYEKSTRVKNDQLGRVRNITEKLERAENFLEAIDDQRPLWQQRLEEFDVLSATALSRVTIAIAAQVYLGPFTTEFRKILLDFAWPDVLEERGLPTGASPDGPTYSCAIAELMTFIASQDDICVWDESWCTDFMKLNHAALQSSVRFPMMIDPHGAGVTNVIQLEHELKREHKLVILDATYEEKSISNLVRRAEVAWKTGIPVLIKNIGNAMPSELFDFLLSAQRDQHVHVLKYKRPVAFGNNLCRVAEQTGSRIYLSTREADFQPPAELSSLLTVINYELGLDEVSGMVSVCLEERCGDLVEGTAYSDWVKLRRTGNGLIRTIDELDEGILVELQSLGFSSRSNDDAIANNLDASASDVGLSSQGDVTAEQLELEAALVAKVRQKQDFLAQLDDACASLDGMTDPRASWKALSTFGARVFTLLRSHSALENEAPIDMQTFLVMFANVIESSGGEGGADARLPEVAKGLLALIESGITGRHQSLVRVLVCIGGIHLDSNLGKGSRFFCLTPSLQRFIYTKENGFMFKHTLANLVVNTRTTTPAVNDVTTDDGFKVSPERGAMGRLGSVVTFMGNDDMRDDDMRDYGNTAQLDAQYTNDNTPKANENVGTAENSSNETTAGSSTAPTSTLDKLLAILPAFASEGNAAVTTDDAVTDAADVPEPETYASEQLSTQSGQIDSGHDKAEATGVDDANENARDDGPVEFPANEFQLSELAFLCLDIIEPEDVDGIGPVDTLSNAQLRRLDILDQVVQWRRPASALVDVVTDGDTEPAWQSWLGSASPGTDMTLVEEWGAGFGTPINTALLHLLVVRALCPGHFSDALERSTQSLQGIDHPDGEQYRKSLPYFVNELVPSLQLPNKIDFGSERTNTVVPLLLVQGPDATSTSGVDSVKLAAHAQGLPRDKIRQVVLLPGQHQSWLRTLQSAYAQGQWLIVDSVHVLGDELVDFWGMLATMGEMGEGVEEDHKSAPGKSDCRIFFTTCVGAELPPVVVRSCVRIVCEHNPTLGTTFVDAAAMLGDSEEKLVETLQTQTQRMCAMALCICQSLISARLKSNHQDPGTAPKQFFGCDIAHIVRFLPFVLAADVQDDDTMRRAFLRNAETFYTDSCDRKIDQTLCRLYVREWFGENPLEKIEALLPGGTKALAAGPQEWLDSMRKVVEQEVNAVELQHKSKVQSLVAEVASVINDTFTFSVLSEVADFYDTPDQNTPSIDLQNSISLLAESILGQLPQEILLGDVKVESAMGKIMLQECICMNTKIQAIKTRIDELDIRASNSEMPETAAMNTQLASLQRGLVPLSWLGAPPSSHRKVMLSSWLANLGHVTESLKRWSGNPSSNPNAIKLAHVCNPSGLMVAFRQDIARKQGLDVNDVVVRLEPVNANGSPRGGALVTDALILEGVSLIGAQWNAEGGVLELNSAEEDHHPVPLKLCAVCSPVQTEQPDEGKSYACPLTVGHSGAPTKIMVTLPTATAEDEFIKRGVRMVLNEVELIN